MYVKHFYQLPQKFKDSYKDREPDWGWGEYSKFVFYRTYSRSVEGKQETWTDVLNRVIEGCMSIRKDWYIKNHIIWDNEYWTKLAIEMYESAFRMEWLPAGRGLWMMGTPFIYERGSMALNNCAFVKLNHGNDFHFMMDCLMLGVGVGFEPTDEPINFVTNYGEYDHIIEDSREGWCDSIRALYNYYTVPGCSLPRYVYDKIRPENLPIKGFGGMSSGPSHLMKLHEQIHEYMQSGHDSVRIKTDIANSIGFCVVAGNVRRSAELCKGKITSNTFLNLKNYELNPDRAAIGSMSNNTCFLYEDEDFDKIGDTIPLILRRGEPGFANLRNFKYGRLEYKHEQNNDRADGLNPCGESTLEDKELCNQAETIPTRCPSPTYWSKNACRYATIYASTVSLLPTHRPEANAVIARNRRITIGFMDYFHWKQKEYLHNITKYMREGYHTCRETNIYYNKQAGVGPAIKVTTIKPGGTVPKLAGCIGGIGYPTFRYTLRRTRVAANSRVAEVLKEHGVPWEPCVYQPKETHIFEFPIEQAKNDFSFTAWEQLLNIIHVQGNFADNAVSNTIYFKPRWEYSNSVKTIEDIWKEEILKFDEFMKVKEDFLIADESEVVLQNYKIVWNEERNEFDIYNYNKDHEESILENVVAFGIGRTKSLSLLPHTKKGAYPQMPEEGITKEEYEYRKSKLKPIDWSRLNETGMGTHFCDSDQCERVADESRYDHGGRSESVLCGQQEVS